MQSIQTVSENTIYVGASDRRLAKFENLFPIPRGVSYNAYVILDEKTALLDTADASVGAQFLENVAAALDGRKLDYLIVDHMEPDHAAMIEAVLVRWPDLRLVVNAKTLPMLKMYFPTDSAAFDDALVVKEGDTLDLGKHKLTFVMAPMVHWPEVMAAYEEEEKILFSADAFGRFGSLERTARAPWAPQARRYYYNIVGKYGAQVQALLKKASALDIQTICPLHGPILKENLEYYIGKYMTWSSYEPEDKGILIAYASIHGNTAKAAKKLKEILESKGAEKVAITDLARDDMAEAIEDAFRYDRMILAAASYDAGVFPCMEDFLHHLKSKAYQKRTVGLLENGSWAPSAARTMKAVVEQMKNVSIVEPVVTIKSTMKDSDIENMEKLADAIINA